MITHPSAGDFAQTLAKLLDAIRARGLSVFAQIDHAAGARDIGLELAPEVVVLFGNARAGTPLMKADPRVGIELPLRILVWEADGSTKVGFNDPPDLVRTYSLGSESATLETMAALLADLAREATE